MKKYVITFKCLGFALVITSIISCISLVAMSFSFDKTYGGDLEGPAPWYAIYRSLAFIFSGLNMTIYPFVTGVICLFFSKLAEMVGGPNFSEEALTFIQKLRATGDKRKLSSESDQT